MDERSTTPAFMFRCIFLGLLCFAGGISGSAKQRPWEEVMLGWFKLEADRASRLNRSSRDGSEVLSLSSTLMATSRPRARSRAW